MVYRAKTTMNKSKGICCLHPGTFLQINKSPVFKDFFLPIRLHLLSESSFFLSKRASSNQQGNAQEPTPRAESMVARGRLTWHLGPTAHRPYPSKLLKMLRSSIFPRF